MQNHRHVYERILVGSMPTARATLQTFIVPSYFLSAIRNAKEPEYGISHTQKKKRSKDFSFNSGSVWISNHLIHNY